MRTISTFFLLISLIGITIFIAGCTSQPGDQVTPAPTANPGGNAITTPPVTITAIATKTASTTETIRSGTTSSGTSTKTPGTTVTTVAPTASATEDHGVKVNVKAKNMAFDTSTITVPTGSRIIIKFENEDSVGHNMAFYTTSAASTTIYRGLIISGPNEITYSFTAPSTPGTYFFRCDPHPSMNGQFVVT